MPYLSETGKRIKDILGTLGIKRSEIRTSTHSERVRFVDEKTGRKYSMMEPRYTTAHARYHAHAVLIAENADMIAAEGLTVHVLTHQCGHVISAFISSAGFGVERNETTSRACRDCVIAANAPAAPVEEAAPVMVGAPAESAPVENADTFTTNDVTLNALRPVLRARAEFAESVHGKDSSEHNVIVGIGFQLADELYGRGEIDNVKAFVRWLFADG